MFHFYKVEVTLIHTVKWHYYLFMSKGSEWQKLHCSTDRVMMHSKIIPMGSIY